MKVSHKMVGLFNIVDFLLNGGGCVGERVGKRNFLWGWGGEEDPGKGAVQYMGDRMKRDREEIVHIVNIESHLTLYRGSGTACGARTAHRRITSGVHPASLPFSRANRVVFSVYREIITQMIAS